MGTNYYIQPKPPCSACGRAYEERHIGKSSAGWCFALHVYPDEAIRDIDDWEKLWKGAIIKDEYGRSLSVSDMRLIIMARTWNGDTEKDPRWYKENDAEPGPVGLARHKLGGHCISHGVGTWDCITGEFS